MPFDPVCGKKIKKGDFKYEYRGRVYYFCSKECMDEFIANPSKYVKSSWSEGSC